MIKPRSLGEQLADAADRPGPDLAAPAFLIARLEFPKLDPGPYLDQLDAMGEIAMQRIASDPGHDAPLAARVDGLNRYLFNELGFVGNREHYEDPRNSCLNEVLDRRTGIPITLALIYIEVARRAGLRAEGVNFPGHFLVRALGLPFRMRDAMRLGFIGLLFNMVVPGAVGGDFVKAAYLMREQSRKTQAAASVAIDRLIGLLGMFVLAVAVGAFSWGDVEPPVRRLIGAAVFLTVAVTAVMAISFAPPLYRPLAVRFAGRRRLSHALHELAVMGSAYRRRMDVVVATVVMSALTHVLNVLAFMIRYLPYGMRFGYAGLLSIHRELEESSAACGGNWGQTVRKILFPLMLQTLFASWIYVFLITIRELSVALLLYSPGSQVVSVVIWELWENGRIGEVAAFSLVFTFGTVLLAALFKQLAHRYSLNE